MHLLKREGRMVWEGTALMKTGVLFTSSHFHCYYHCDLEPAVLATWLLCLLSNNNVNHLVDSLAPKHYFPLLPAQEVTEPSHLSLPCPVVVPVLAFQGLHHYYPTHSNMLPLFPLYLSISFPSLLFHFVLFLIIYAENA